MRYQVPQFIEVEDKIFGPLTLKQFLYVAGGVAIGFLIWRFMPIKFIGLIIAVPVVVFFMALAFYKVNNKPFIFIVESAIKYFFSSKLYIWNKQPKAPTKKEKEEKEYSQVYVPKLSDSKLKELTWGLDINESVANEKMQRQLEQHSNGRPTF